MNFATLQGLTIPQGVVTQIADASGRVLWKLANKKPVVLEVAKSATTSYAGETEYADESVILLDIYPAKYGTVKVTYGGLTKIVTDTSGADEPNAQQVFFGTFQGVSDSVTTPESGTVTIEGNYRGYGRGAYTNAKSFTSYCACITGIQEIGEPSVIGPYTFRNLAGLTLTSLPDCLTYIGDYAFYKCYYIDVKTMPINLITIGNNAFDVDVDGLSYLNKMPMYKAVIVFPSTLQRIGDYVFGVNNQNVGASSPRFNYVSGVVMLSTTPPTISDSSFGNGRVDRTAEDQWPYITITVPKGCSEAYKTMENWSTYAHCITEAS